MEDLQAKLKELQGRKADLAIAYGSLMPTIKGLVALQESRQAQQGTLIVEIIALEQQIADSKVTYSIGDRFKGKGGKLIIVHSGEERPHKVQLVRLSSGRCWTSGVEIKDIGCITALEAKRMFGCRSFTRYWDARKQCKC